EELQLRGRLGEVGKNRHAASIPDRLDRLAWTHPFALDVRRPAPADQPLECILDALGMTRGDQGPPDRRPSERVVPRQVDVADLLVDRESDVAQPLDRSLEPEPARRPL